MSELRILSLGWGVQSFTIAAMIALGEMEPVDVMVHADTTWETERTYQLSAAFTPWLRERGQNIVTVQSDRVDVIQKWASKTEGVMAPVFTLAPDGEQGQLGRQCTRTWKIDPIRRFISGELAERGLKKTAGVVASVQGISFDEWHRMKDSDVKYIGNEYPLVEARITRQGCMIWLEQHDLPIPAKSSCVFCPYHSMAAWKRMGREKGRDFETAVRVDKAVRDKRNNFKLFVHPIRKPLEDAIKDDGQLELFPDATCDSGYCFV